MGTRARAWLLLLTIALLAGIFYGGQTWARNRAFLSLNTAPRPLHTMPLGVTPALASTGADDRVSTALWRGVAAWQDGAAGDAVAFWTPLPEDTLLEWGRHTAQGGALADALLLFTMAAARHPEVADPWYFRGAALYAAGRWAPAAAALTSALQQPAWQQATSGDAWFLLGLVHREGRPAADSEQRAAAAFRAAAASEAFTRDDLPAEAWQQLGDLTLRELGDPAGSLPFFRAALQANPNHDWARLRLGYALYLSGAGLDEALAVAEEALAGWDDPRYRQWPYFYLGEMYAAAGRPAAAREALTAALAIDPAFAAAQTMLDALSEP